MIGFVFAAYAWRREEMCCNLHTLNVWKAGVGAYEDVVLFAFQDGFLHDERIAGVKLSRLVILIMSLFVCCERFE